MRFSQRIGEKPVRTSFQVREMDDDLRNGLWNAILTGCLEPLEGDLSGFRSILLRDMWSDFFKLPIDELARTYSMNKIKLRTWFFEKAKWNEVYDLVEFIARALIFYGIDSTLINECNRVMEREKSGYRFVGNKIAPITSSEEIDAIEEVINSGRLSGVESARVHIETALGLFSDRKEPDFRNSIKESISAVEAVARKIAGDEKAELGTALRRIEEEIGLHGALKSGFSSIYGYTSDDDGIRHALKEVPDVGFDDAKFMLVACSAFVNYLISKAIKAGLL